MPEAEGRIIALSVSDQKGVPKKNVPEVELLRDHGIAGDAHAGPWHRQVSLLALESIETMRCKGADVGPGAFAENITTQGLDLTSLQIGDHVFVGDADLEVTQIGKECHDRCAIFEAVGDCVMPREGIFARVVAGGRVRVGDVVSIRRRGSAG
jgi:MOSC domain-containing protein YiiM